MKKIINLLIIILTVLFNFNIKVNSMENKKLYDIEIESITGEIISLSKYKGKTIFLVNVASNCGFTKQYSDLQNLWEKYREKDLIVIGMPSNQFGGQEPGSNSEIKDFCETNFGIDFPISEKTDVIGKNAHPFYQWAKKNHGISAIPKWNFHKIIIGKNGKIVETFASFTKPNSKKFIKLIEAQIKSEN